MSWWSGLLHISWGSERRIWSNGGMILAGKPKNLEKTCSCANFSATDPTWTDREANPALAVRNQDLTA
jgi:hypothetical protein